MRGEGVCIFFLCVCVCVVRACVLVCTCVRVSE